MLEKLRRPVSALERFLLAACCLLAGLLLGGFIFQCAHSDLEGRRETASDGKEGW